VKALLVVVSALLCASTAFAQTKLFSGYIKDIYQDERSFLNNAPLSENLTRARLELDLHGGPVALVADYDHEWITGSYLGSLDRKVFGLSRAPTWLDLDWTLRDDSNLFWRHRFYRLFGQADAGDWQVRAGRQLVAWGTGKIWNPTDVLNPYQPLSIERDERQGVDALYARRELGALSRVEAAYAPMSNWGASTAVSRIHANAAETDVSLMGGKPALGDGAWMVGGDAARDVSGSGLHAEWAYTGGPQPGWRYAVGWERTIQSPAPLKDAWLLAEYYHNGLGQASPAAYDYASLLTGRQPYLARDYLGFAFREDIHPLLKAEAYVIWNLNDGSAFVGPLLSWDVFSSLVVSAGWQHFANRLTGSSSVASLPGEFGRPPDVGFLQGQYYF
jgi:hypothetical protein